MKNTLNWFVGGPLSPPPLLSTPSGAEAARGNGSAEIEGSSVPATARYVNYKNLKKSFVKKGKEKKTKDLTSYLVSKRFSRSAAHHERQRKIRMVF